MTPAWPGWEGCGDCSSPCPNQMSEPIYWPHKFCSGARPMWWNSLLFDRYIIRHWFLGFCLQFSTKPNLLFWLSTICKSPIVFLAHCRSQQGCLPEDLSLYRPDLGPTIPRLFPIVHYKAIFFLRWKVLEPLIIDLIGVELEKKTCPIWSSTRGSNSSNRISFEKKCHCAVDHCWTQTEIKSGYRLGIDLKLITTVQMTWSSCNLYCLGHHFGGSILLPLRAGCPSLRPNSEVVLGTNATAQCFFQLIT